MEIIEQQKLLSEKYGSSFCESSSLLKVGISKNIKDGLWLINGMRHPLIGDITGWYIWAGEFSTEDDFFIPLHVEHLTELCPIVLKYLGLAPGWRFLVTENYEDVWEDKSLLNIDN